MSGIRSLTRSATVKGTAYDTSAPIYVNSNDNKVKVVPAGSGTTEVEIVDASSTQTLTNKTLTNPTINGQTLSGTTQTGVAGAAGAVTQIVVTKVLVNNTLTDFATVTVPNVIAGCGIKVEVVSTLGDGDSSQMSIWDIAVARIPGAAGAATASTVGVSATKAGATGNAVVTVAPSAFSGAVGATNTFTVQIRNARSAGTADNHPTTAIITLINVAAGGCTMVAA